MGQGPHMNMYALGTGYTSKSNNIVQIINITEIHSCRPGISHTELVRVTFRSGCCYEWKVCRTKPWKCGRSIEWARHRPVITRQCVSSVGSLTVCQSATLMDRAMAWITTPAARLATYSTQRSRAAVSHQSPNSSTCQPPTAVISLRQHHNIGLPLSATRSAKRFLGRKLFHIFP